jgi:hypothetical protein
MQPSSVGVSRISRDDYAVVRDFIDGQGLWQDVGQPVVRLRPILERFGWVIRERHDMAHLALFGLAVRDRKAKLLYLNARVGCGAERTVLAHTLAHEILGHEIPIDEIRPTEYLSQRRVPVCEELESPTRAATAILLIPSVYIESHLLVEEIATYCKTTENVVRRRLSGIAVGDEDNAVLRFDRRGAPRFWQRELLDRTGTDSLSIRGGGG